MPVTNSLYFTKQNIEENKFSASPALAEQAVYCLELVAELNKAGLNFQFKGGNSLLLVLEKPERFSIDVDIATDCTREDIEQCLDYIIKEYITFTKWEKRQHKTKPWIPLSSYYLFYPSLYDSSETNIMLDAQLRRSPYRTGFKKVSSGNLYRSDIETEIPYPESIIGDKLLTLGPSTLGIPIGKGKEAQRLKHVFDIARLLRTSPKVSLIRESFNACLHHENEIQGTTIPVRAIVDDTVEFCRSVTHHDSFPSGQQFTGVLQENVAGLEPFAKHLFRSGYNWIDLQRDTALVALCITAVGLEHLSDSDFCSMLLKNWKNSNKSTILKQNPEAGYYWDCISQL